jgi:hypothetical protein
VLFVIQRSLKDIIAVPVKWRSWFWQHLVNHPHKSRRLMLAERGPARPLVDLACQSAFWNLSKSFIVKVALDCGIVVDPGLSLFDTLCFVVRTRLGLDEEATLNIVGLRMQTHNLNNRYSKALYECDAALEVMERDDREKYHSQQDEQRRHDADRAEFAHTFVQSRVAIAKAKAAPKAKAAGKAKAKAKAAPPAPPDPAWPTVIDFEAAKLLTPVGATVWRGHIRKEWCGHHEISGATRVQAPWACAGGEWAALKSVLQRLWRSHSEWFGVPLDASAPRGLFDPDGRDADDSDAEVVV